MPAESSTEVAEEHASSVVRVPRRPSAKSILHELSKVRMMRALPPEEMQKAVEHIEVLSFRPGMTVVAAGEPDYSLYLLTQGDLDVFGDDPSKPLRTLHEGDAFGEVALLKGEPRQTTVKAGTEAEVLRLDKPTFDRLVETSPVLAESVRKLAESHLALGTADAPDADSARQDAVHASAWRGIALRAMAARQGGLKGWQTVMGLGVLIWLGLRIAEAANALPVGADLALAAVNLLAGVMVLQGACEAFVVGVERLGARKGWDGFTCGTIGSLVATLPEFVVIAFLVAVEPLAAFVTSAVTIFNNAIAFSIYSFFLPKDQKGSYLMPRSVAKAGGELLVAGGGLALIVGIVMLVVSQRNAAAAFSGLDLLVVGGILIMIYAQYVVTLVRYYVENEEDQDPGHPPDPDRLGHPIGWGAIVPMFVLGIGGAYVGGESIGTFAETALNQLGLPTIPTASALAFFAGISEYIIVFKAHRRGELGIALSNVFGGMSQVMFLLLPFSMIVTGILGISTGSALYTIPLSIDTILLVLLLFPLFFVLLEYLKEDHTLSNLDASAMTGIYALLLYFLFTSSS